MELIHSFAPFLQRFMADILSVLALTMSEEGDRVSSRLSYKLQSVGKFFWYVLASRLCSFMESSWVSFLAGKFAL